MSEETQESGMSAVKKAIIGAITTAVTAGGAWFATHLGGGEEPKEEVKTEQVAPAPVVINLENNNTNQQKQSSGGTNTIIKERVIEKPAATPAQPAAKPKADEEDPW
jgi:flagellar basal body-associated protein FliL